MNDTSRDVSVRILGELDDRSIDRYELTSARRALRLIKGKLGPERLHALVIEQVAEGNTFFRDHVKRSGGERATGTITVEATGLLEPLRDRMFWSGLTPSTISRRPETRAAPTLSKHSITTLSDST